MDLLRQKKSNSKENKWTIWVSEPKLGLHCQKKNRQKMKLEELLKHLIFQAEIGAKMAKK